MLVPLKSVPEMGRKTFPSTRLESWFRTSPPPDIAPTSPSANTALSDLHIERPALDDKRHLVEAARLTAS